MWGFKDYAVLIVESALTGSKDNSSDKGGGSTSHVDNTGSGEIDDTDITARIVTECSQKTITTPDRAEHNGVDDSGVQDSIS